VGDEGTGKKFRGGLSSGQRENLVCGSLFEEKEGRKWRVARGSDTGVTVPGGTIHLVAVVFLANNDAIVAEKCYAGLVPPEASGSAFAGAGVAEEEITRAVFVTKTECMNLHAIAESEAMHHGQFVDGIFERENRLIGGEAIAAKNDMAAFERRIEPSCFVGRKAKGGTGEIKLCAGTASEGGPEASGDEGWGG
jgi:hypothetical protein